MEIRSTLVRLLLVVPLLAAGIALGDPSPAAAATVCNGERSDVIRDSVVVPAGATCTLTGAVVRGGVTVEAGALFQASPGTEIRGSVTATAPASFFVFDSVVRGSVTVTGGMGMVTLAVSGSQVRGDLILTGNSTGGSEDILVRGNTVRGSVVLTDNTAGGGDFLVIENAIEVNLDCSGNIPAPFAPFGDLNTVGGVATGQCAGLVAP